MRKLISMMILLVFGLTWSSPLIAQENQPEMQTCAPHEAVIGHLKSEYIEGQAVIGLANNGHVMQIYSTKSGSSWTIILSNPDGTTCLVMAGENLEIIKRIDDIKVFYINK